MERDDGGCHHLCPAADCAPECVPPIRRSQPHDSECRGLVRPTIAPAAGLFEVGDARALPVANGGYATSGNGMVRPYSSAAATKVRSVPHSKISLLTSGRASGTYI